MIEAVNKKRPVNLDLTTMKFPPMAIVSILHRISGMIMFLFLPGMLYILELSLKNAQTFDQLKDCLASPWSKLFLWAFSVAVMYHLLAGIRHIIMDFGYGEELNAGRRSAVFVIILAVILSILLGIWIW